jgi:hypothetical protein
LASDVFGLSTLRSVRRVVPPLMRMLDPDADLRALLLTLQPKARDELRRVLIRDDADRDAIAMRLMRYGDENGQGWADIIDFLTMYPDARRKVARVLAEMDAV